MRHTFQAEQWLPYPVDLVFAFFSNPQNLPPLMPAWQKARVEEAMLASPPQGPPSRYRLRGAAAGVGSSITLSFRPVPFSPLRIPWEATITEFVWNEFFCDIQEPGRGPFAYWHHCHRVATLAKDGVSGTNVNDEVEYELPFGSFGEMAHGLVRRQIEKTFTFRQQRVAEILSQAMGGASAAASARPSPQPS